MKIKVLQDTVQSFAEIKNAGIPSGGAATTKNALTQPIVTAEFPSQRAAGIDNAYNASSLYNNGLLFTAYEFTGGFAPGSKDNYRSLRQAAQNAQQILSANTGNVRYKQVLSNRTIGTLNPICQILLPRSLNDNEVNSHRYQDATDSIVAKGLSRAVSNVIWGAIESASGGILADRREAVDVGTKAAFQGSDKRTKMYYNTFVIESRYDLLELIKIYYLFTVLGYGTTSGGTAAEIAELAKQTINTSSTAGAKLINNAIAGNGPTPTVSNGSIISDQAVDFVTNIEVIKSPPVWFIRDFQTGDSLRFPHSTFGPAGITSVRFGRTMDNIVNTLRESPNTPIAVEIEIQFMELIDMRQDSIFDTQY
ncbi:putative baseplate tail tube cap [Cronobacter phage vB_CsaM_Invicta]|uniref:Putative baseplate tail tube cap n=1 Tax=Cronobacter phage vB_CsaM_SemperBestia TaxID=2777353 RepID=A0A7T3TLL2_9CAUD|nr:putative baseplate tail tube cap [Cronobacter phage vB_CsaM_SemperBestia]UGV22923.1 putative baseplate tail tube cap [Cronobacter phage vB_CsaM_Invicta]